MKKKKPLTSCKTPETLNPLLKPFLSAAESNGNLSDSELKNLWKPIFISLQNPSKTPNQVTLIETLTSLFISVHPSISLQFFRGFFVAVRRNWPGIDKSWLENFDLLIRKFIRVLFEVLRLRNWDLEVLEGFCRILEKDGFLAEDKLRGSGGICYRVVSVFFTELKEVRFPVREDLVGLILRPFYAVLMRSEDRVLCGKVRSFVFDELVKAGKVVLEKRRNGEVCDELLGVVALKMGLSRRLYEVGYSVECVQGNRKVVLELYEEFLKLEKELELSGVEIVVPEYNDVVSGGGGGDEVPRLIPSEFCTSNGNASEGENGLSEINSMVEENGDLVKVNTPESSQTVSGDVESNGNVLALNGIMLLNLQKQFEKVVAEASSGSDEDLDFSNARKRRRTNSNGDGGVDAESVKKVRFSMKNNLVWKPQTPLPPLSLRLPPSVTPRGSAMKKGVPPGPVVELLVVTKKTKQKKKAQNRLKSVKTVAKKRKKVRTRST